MKIFILIISQILLSHIAQAEYLVKGKVTNEQDQPIPFVNIGFVGTSIGTVSTVNGNFVLNLTEIPDKSIPLRISCMGFEPVDLVLTAEIITQPVNVKLKEKTLLLEEMVVKPGKLKTKEYGNDSENTSMKTNLAISDKPNMNLGAEIGRKFRLGKEPNFLSKMKFYVGYNNFDTLMIRVNFYEIKSGKPENTLHHQPIVRQVVNHKSGWVTFDLEEEDIVLSGSIVASIEWIGASKKGNNFGLNISMPALFQTHYYKYGAQNKWKVFPNMSSSMVLVVESEN
jgi:hypothetical protein